MELIIIAATVVSAQVLNGVSCGQCRDSGYTYCLDDIDLSVGNCYDEADLLVAAAIEKKRYCSSDESHSNGVLKGFTCALNHNACPYEPSEINLQIDAEAEDFTR
jgi:hypothetical protein